MKEKKDRVEDACMQRGPRSRKASYPVEALRWCGHQQALHGRELKGNNHDQNVGIRIVLRAMVQPLLEIVANAGVEPSLVLDKIIEGKGGFGYNAQSDAFGDLMEIGVLDPAKVVRVALQNAASIAGLLITTEGMIAQKPTTVEPAPLGAEEWSG